MSGVRQIHLWECDCGTYNRVAGLGLQHPCYACNHPAPLEAVTAIDQRDVMPLVEAANKAARYGPLNGRESSPYILVPVRVLVSLRAALAPFETGDGS